MGTLTSFALIVFGIMFWGVIAVLNRYTSQGWPLTLPSIAGTILTIGVVADSSVVIFERVREEIRRGKSVRTAADSGFSNALKTILDANFVTFIVAVALVILGVGPIRGFAVALAVGVILNIITTVFFTRSMLALLVRVKAFESPWFIGARAQEVANR